MNFRSDNNAAAAAEIIAALTSANEAFAVAYGGDPWSQKLDETFSALFEREVRVFTVASGTAANAISLASVTPPWGAIVCHREAHIECDECGAPEFFSGGAKLVLVDGPDAKVTPEALREAVSRNARGIHSVAPSAVSISQISERGGVYAPAEVAALGEAARAAGLAFHVDGARFANAVAALGCRPGDITWRAGVDVLSFGATKNGAIAAEAIVCFDLDRAEEIARRRKRGGHLFCKGRYPAAQLLAYLEGGLWLKLAARANALAKRLAEAAGRWLASPPDANMVFINPGAAALANLRAAGMMFYEGAGADEARLVVSWNQPEAEVAQACALLRKL
ncbi:MAG: low specificity L-threonine aldolase [Hyphomonadaceae bacterium]